MYTNQAPKFVLTVDGQPFMEHDEQESVVEVFYNLSGSNFDRPEDHQKWLREMAEQHSTALQLTGAIKLIAPDGRMRTCGSIGTGLRRPDPVAGQEYMVKTYRFGGFPVWHKTTMVSFNPETATTREHFVFNSDDGVLVVFRTELMDKVLPVNSETCSIN